MKRYVSGIAAIVAAASALLLAPTPAEAAPRARYVPPARYYGPGYGGQYRYGPSYLPYRDYYQAPYYSGYRYPGYYPNYYRGYPYGYPQSGFGIQTPNFGFWFRR